MKKVDPLVAYLITLAVIQPARVQDIESFMPDYIGPSSEEFISSGEIRRIHSEARSANLVMPIRKGLYALAPAGNDLVRAGVLSDQIDNRRLFLIKRRRKAIK